ncbi:MAG TPA: hypothetical protein VGR52_13130 [Stellaceae bacterium]|nr:hypothetical protein [Stellaceae bacterium]
MGRIVWAGVVVVLGAVLAMPARAQTNEACVLRCLDRGHLDQYCQAVCTNGVPAAAPVAPNRSSAPAQQPAPPLATQSPPAAPAPANAPQSAPSVVQPAPQPAQNFVAPPPAQNAAPLQPVQNQAPPQPAAQSAPQQVAKPPALPVNEACYLRCVDHGHLDQYCQRVCTVKSPPP